MRKIILVAAVAMLPAFAFAQGTGGSGSGRAGGAGAALLVEQPVGHPVTEGRPPAMEEHLYPAAVAMQAGFRRR